VSQLKSVESQGARSGDAIVFARATLGYRTAAVVDGLDLALAAGRTHGLIGPSGSGKSTLLKAVTGIISPTQGTVSVLGRETEPARSLAQRAANRAIGLVLQEGGLFPHLRAGENIALPALVAGWAASRIAERRAVVAELARLPEALFGRYPNALSGGQRQRVALARALLLDPPLLLLDEPLSALDPPSRAELQDEMKALFARLEKTVVLVTHDIAEALHLADTITLLDQGRVVQHGPAELVAREPGSAWASAFLRSAAPRWRAMLSRIDGSVGG
jgi:osmoprotectant transport system ATP-binding protein